MKVLQKFVRTMTSRPALWHALHKRLPLGALDPDAVQRLHEHVVEGQYLLDKGCGTVIFVLKDNVITTKHSTPAFAGCVVISRKSMKLPPVLQDADDSLDKWGGQQVGHCGLYPGLDGAPDRVLLLEFEDFKTADIKVRKDASGLLDIFIGAMAEMLAGEHPLHECLPITCQMASRSTKYKGAASSCIEMAMEQDGLWQSAKELSARVPALRAEAPKPRWPSQRSVSS